MSSSHYKEGSL